MMSIFILAFTLYLHVHLPTIPPPTHLIGDWLGRGLLCGDVPLVPLVFLWMLTTHTLSPGTKICHGVFRGQAASGLRGDASEFRQNEIPLKACEIVSCAFTVSIRNGIQSGLILASLLSYGTRKIAIVTSITNTHCFLSFAGQEDGHWCTGQRVANTAYYSISCHLHDVVLQYRRQWMVKETQQTSQTCALCLIELQMANEIFSV